MHTETNRVSSSIFVFCFFFTCTNIAFVQNLGFNQEFEEQIVATYWIDNEALSIIVTLFVLIFMVRL